MKPQGHGREPRGGDRAAPRKDSDRHRHEPDLVWRSGANIRDPVAQARTDAKVQYRGREQHDVLWWFSFVVKVLRTENGSGGGEISRSIRLPGGTAVRRTPRWSAER